MRALCPMASAVGGSRPGRGIFSCVHDELFGDRAIQVHTEHRRQPHEVHGDIRQFLLDVAGLAGLHDGAGFGFGIAVEADTSVTGNVIENAPKWGMSLGWGPYLRNIVATGNIIRQAPVGIAVSVVEGAGTALISDNILQETPDGGVVGFRWNDRATDELALSGANGFSHLTVERNRL